MNRALKISARNFLITVLCLFVAVYLSIQYFRGRSGALETTPARLMTRTVSVDMNGYIFRDEPVISSAGGGYVSYLVPDGGRIGVSQPVAKIYKSGDVAGAEAQSKEYERELNILRQSDINAQYSPASKDKIDEDINLLYTEILLSAANRDLSGGGRRYDDMLVLLNKRQIVTYTGNLSDTIGAKISALEAKKAECDAILTSGRAADVTAPETGNFYSSTDGYEGIFNISALGGMTVPSFDALTARPPEPQPGAIGKILTDFNWYTVCKVAKDGKFEADPVKFYKMQFAYTPNEPLNCTLDRVVDQPDGGETLLIFKLTDSPPDFNFTRAQPVKLIYQEITGLKVPEQAVRVITDKATGTRLTGVYVLKENLVVFKTLPDSDMLGKFEGYYIYKAAGADDPDYYAKLNLNEEIITAGKNIYDGAVVR